MLCPSFARTLYRSFAKVRNGGHHKTCGWLVQCKVQWITMLDACVSNLGDVIWVLSNEDPDFQVVRVMMLSSVFPP